MTNELQQLFHDNSHLQDAVLPVLSGCAMFGATLAMSTAAQKLVGVSTATKVLPTLNGIVTVCAASLASERAAILAHQWQQHPTTRFDVDHIKSKVLGTSNQVVNLTRRVSSNSYKQLQQFHDQQARYLQDGNRMKQRENNAYTMESPFHSSKLPMHEIRVCLLGLLTFKILGGRFWAISPSSYTHLGSFARWSIPCSSAYATTNQRAMIETMGRKWGCHTCGSRMLLPSKSLATKSFRFVGDHMPPKSVAEQMNRNWLRKLKVLPQVQFRFYPQCVTCSNAQGSILSKATHQMKSQLGLSRMFKAAKLHGAGGGTMAHFHGWRFRINHLTGSGIAMVTVIGASDKEISKGNPKRLEQWQHRVSCSYQDIRRRIQSFQ